MLFLEGTKIQGFRVIFNGIRLRTTLDINYQWDFVLWAL